MTTRTQYDRKRGRLPPEQINTPETVFHVVQERQPGGAIGVLLRLVVTGENPANHVFVDLDVKRQGHLLCNSRRAAPVGIPLLHFDYRTDEFYARSFRPGCRRSVRRKPAASDQVSCLLSELC
jgi:hypothetical protein